MRSNLPSSERVFCGEGLLDCGAPPTSVEEACVGLMGVEEASTELLLVDFGIPVGLTMVSSEADFFSSFATTLSDLFSISPDAADPLRSLPSTSTLIVSLILLLCREFVLRGGAGGCLVLVTDKLREQFCLVFASSPTPNDPETLDSDPWTVTPTSLLVLRLLIMLAELCRLTRSGSPVDCSVWLSFPFTHNLLELPLCVLPLEDTEEQFEIMVFED